MNCVIIAVYFHMKLLCLTFLFFTSFSGFSQHKLDSFQLEVPELGAAIHYDIWATEYYAHVTKNGGDIPCLTVDGDTLGLYSDSCNFCTACLEGTVILEDSTGKKHVLNYAGRADDALINCRTCSQFANSSLRVESWGSVRWKRSSNFGEGVKGFALVPYRTIAVDPRYIPYGTVLYIPEAKGALFTDSNGTTMIHDGYFFAGDTGGAIKEWHIDVFTGVDASHPFAFVKSTPKYVVKAYVINNELLIQEFLNLHTPGN